jgi:hypothetical protein
MTGSGLKFSGELLRDLSPREIEEDHLGTLWWMGRGLT